MIFISQKSFFFHYFFSFSTLIKLTKKSIRNFTNFLHRIQRAFLFLFLLLLRLVSLQSSITAENSLAYKSLVEDPKELIFMKQIETTRDDDVAACIGISTLPRSPNTQLEHVPQSNKAATLSKLLKKSKDSEQSSSPLRILRDKSFPIVKPRLTLHSVGSESVNSTTFLLDHDCENPCETPSYMTKPVDNFALNLNTKPIEPPKVEVKPIERQDNNPLPLPPRDRNAVQLNVSQKRHVRKYPLIIPATGVQRTLDKINQITPVEEKTDVFPIPLQQIELQPTIQAPSAVEYSDDDDDDDVFEDLKNDTKISQEFEENVNHYGMIKCQEKNYTKDFIENNFPSTPLGNSFIELSGQRIYENLEAFQERYANHAEGDTASLHFESILESDESFGKNAPIPDDMVDGFCVFEAESSKIPSTSNGITHSLKKPENVPAIKNVPSPIIESKKLEFSQKYPKYKMPRNELASNALFNKIKESVEMAALEDVCEIELETNDANETDLKKSINHVSCEDLLDFSENKPKGRERGAESDEVRIMTKVLGKQVCLLTDQSSFVFLIKTFFFSIR